MKQVVPPLNFVCKAKLRQAPEEIARQILDITQWPHFHGYGPIPGIEKATFERRTPDIVGSRIRVRNRDGSTHLEEIVQWQPPETMQLRMSEFSAPLCYLANSFLETWEFQRDNNETAVTRAFEVNAKSIMTVPIMWFLSFFIKRAIAKHLHAIGAQPERQTGTC